MELYQARFGVPKECPASISCLGSRSMAVTSLESTVIKDLNRVSGFRTLGLRVEGFVSCCGF